MIVFDMQCSNGHVFEGWFDSAESFEAQNSKGLVSCPYCEDTEVKKVLSPVAVKKMSSGGKIAPAPIDYQKLAKEVIEYIYNNSDDVGAGFAAEALKMHYGVIEKKNIRGTATPEEEKCLDEEGIDFVKLPLPKIDNDKKN